jgi:hypothetical protein
MKASLFAALLWYAGVAAGKSAGAGAEVVTSDVPSLSTSSLLTYPSNIKLDIHPSQPTDIVEQPSMDSSVRVKKNFLSKFETYLYRHNENKYKHMKAVGFSGDRTWGGAYLPRSFMRRLVGEGAEQCTSDDYVETLPSGVNVVTSYVRETTCAHLDVDVNPQTLKYIKNDVGVVFLNTNEDASFVVGDKAIPVEEGTLVMFPGGSVSHHTEMKKEGGFVHMLGPFEVGGSHGPVGYPVDERCKMVYALSSSGDFVGGAASFKRRRRQLEGEGGTNSDTNNKEGAITGEMYIFGYRNGTDPSGTKNQTLEVQFHDFNLDAIDAACSTGACTVELNDSTNTCDDSNNDSEETRVTLHNNLAEAVSEIGYIDVGRNVEELFDLPISIHDNNGNVLACAIFTEIDDVSPDAAATDSASGAMCSTVGLTALITLVSSLVTYLF